MLITETHFCGLCGDQVSVRPLLCFRLDQARAAVHNRKPWGNRPGFSEAIIGRCLAYLR
jgi:hypothetical protein